MIKLIKKFTASNGINFIARLVFKNDTYGLGSSLTHDRDDPLIEFYDSRYPHTEYGQFVSRYFVSPLLGDEDFEARGLDLQGDVPDWKIDAASLKAVFDWVRDVMDKGPDVYGYLQSHGLHCPNCGSGELDVGNFEFDGSRCYQNVSCEVCGSEWVDHYTLTGCSIINLSKIKAKKDNLK
ncbi:MAG: hypothetical protein KGI54_05880 [Pseudomonadota bacterium]|nr:hypothetical protein [Pseudomonadota bacterium]